MFNMLNNAIAWWCPPTWRARPPAMTSSARHVVRSAPKTNRRSTGNRVSARLMWCRSGFPRLNLGHHFGRQDTVPCPAAPAIRRRGCHGGTTFTFRHRARRVRRMATLKHGGNRTVDQDVKRCLETIQHAAEQLNVSERSAARHRAKVVPP